MPQHQQLEFIRSELTTGFMFVSLARNYAKSGHLIPSLENLEHARATFEEAKQAFEKLAGLGESDRAAIEELLRTLGSQIDLLSK